MKHFFLVLIICISTALTGASAQSGPMDTCQTVSACDAAANRLIVSALETANTGYYRDAARELYPVVLNQTISPMTKARAANAFSNILERSELYVHAAGQKANANAVTRAPASADLLAHARLLAKTKEEDATKAAYDTALNLALAAGNLQTFDGIVSDYRRKGDRKRVRELQALRSEIEVRAEDACAFASCKSRGVTDAKVITVGPVKYPSGARRKSGTCRVTLNLTEDGRPVDLVPDCTDPVFIEAAMIAVQQSTFSVNFKDGVPTPRYNIIMPFEFAPG